MNTLNQNKFAIAVGSTVAIIYFGCFLSIIVLGKDLLIRFSNILFHGIDFTSIIRTEIPLWESLCGVIISFVFWGIIGYITATIYNKLA